MATLPRAIQAQVEQADAVLAELNKPAENPLDPGVAPTANQPVEVVQVPEQPAPAPQPPAPAPQPDLWEHKYKSLQGRYNSDVPALQGKVKDLETQLQQAIERLDRAATQTEKQVQKPSADPKDVEAFGADLVEMVQRVAEQMFGSAARNIQEQAVKFEQRLADLETALKGTSQTVAMTAEQAFFDRLSKLVPDWEQVNTNPGFLDWLREVDPLLGAPRQSALDAAQQQLNAERVANVFKAFQATQPQQQAPKPNPVDKQVSPKAAASTAPAPTEKPVISQKQVSDFYNDVARGKYRGREAEAARIEAVINAAMAEGRIR